MTEKINITWAYPNILNLHGDRGNLMALARIGKQMKLPVEINRHEKWQEPLSLDNTDLLFLAPGEVKNMVILIAALSHQKEELAKYVARGGYIIAIGSSGSLLAQKTIRQDGSVFAGLSLLPMNCRERSNVYGDDIWYNLIENPEVEILGNQIQILDTELLESGQAFGQIIYGHGNNGMIDEGCFKDNVVFTNALGPVFVKNPRFTQQVLANIAKQKNITDFSLLTEDDTDYEDKSAILIKRFIEKKRA